MKLAYLFPGQGSQAVGMGEALAAEHGAARETFETADRVLGFGLSKLCWIGPADELKSTENAQPALLTHSIAALRALEDRNPELRPTWTAGHSLGEYSACVAAGALEFDEALRLVRRRGELMRDADPERRGTMAALIGMDGAAAERICEDAREYGIVVPANLNARGQVVISGERRAVEAVAELARERRAKVVMLEVSGAFHSPLMKPARDELAEEIDRATFREPRCPVVANAEARPLETAAEIREALKRQLTEKVRWEESMQVLVGLGAEGFLEVGTGRVLRGLLGKIDNSAKCWNVEDPQSLDTALGELKSLRVSAGTAT